MDSSPLQSTALSSAAAKFESILAPTIDASATYIASSAAAAVTATQNAALSFPASVDESASWLGMMGRAVYAMARVIPGILIWIITFTTITLPTVLFALFSTSLTFTMNFTTLYYPILIGV